jgi:DNA-binding XRE family transcriptional regulator
MTDQSSPTTPTPPAGFVRGNDRLDALLSDPARAARVAAIDTEAEEIDRAYKMNLATVRKAGQLTQVEIAQRLGVAQTSISRLEARHDLLLSTLMAYLNAAGVTDVAITGTINGRHIEIDLATAGADTPDSETLTTS